MTFFTSKRLVSASLNFTLRTGYQKAALLGAAALLFGSFGVSAQVFDKAQGFNNPNISDPKILNFTSGTPTNQAAAGYFNEDFTKPVPASGAFGASDQNASITPNTISAAFETQVFQANSTKNELTFDVGQSGQFGFDNNNRVQVDISLNKATPKTVLTINGPNSNGAPSFNIGAGALGNASYDSPQTVTQGTIATNANPSAGAIGRFAVYLPNFVVRTTVDVTITVQAARKSIVLIDNVAISSSSPLPVELTRFAATAKSSGVYLAWATASEKNSDRFEIQRSATGEAYEIIGRVAAQGTSTSAHEYTFVDAKPLAGQAYYRLRQVDTDGTAAYSPVATVRPNVEFAIYPNPTSDFVTLPTGLDAVRYRVLNGLGQALASGQAAGGDRLDLRALPKGSFFLELNDAAGRRTQRLMRQ